MSKYIPLVINPNSTISPLNKTFILSESYKNFKYITIIGYGVDVITGSMYYHNTYLTKEIVLNQGLNQQGTHAENTFVCKFIDDKTLSIPFATKDGYFVKIIGHDN